MYVIVRLKVSALGHSGVYDITVSSGSHRVQARTLAAPYRILHVYTLALLSVVTQHRNNTN